MAGKNQVTFSIDGRELSMPRGTMILDAAAKLRIKIPTLCHHEKLKPAGACRLCHVEVTTPARQNVLMPACATAVEEGMVVRTDTERVAEARRFILALALARAPQAPKLVALAREYGVELKADAADPLCAFLHRRVAEQEAAVGAENLSWCILCGQCVRVCAEVVGMRAIGTAYRGPRKKIATPYFDISPTCIGCGSCAYVCPTDAITISPAE
jgi:NADH dehydrogenase/NADH:ubiquinone oxidoreductase subunit G